ncbi:MAG: hypothetical protein Q9196_003420 [Gyalolechia fulgens]
MVEAMDRSYAFHHHTRSMSYEALASTIVPLHSDVSTSTSVTASPLELLDDLNPPVELKAPLPEIEPPDASSLDILDGKPQEIPLARGTKSTGDPQLEPVAVEYSVEIPQQPMEEPYRGGRTEAQEEPEMEQTNEQRPDQANLETVEPSPTRRVSDLKGLIDLEHYHRSQTVTLRNTLDNLVLADGINRRLLPSLSIAYQGMTDCYQNGDQAGFADLYRACEDLRNTCKSHVSGEDPAVNLSPPLLDQGLQHPNSWLARLPPDCQEHLLDFITRLRTDPHFLADRLSAVPFDAFAEFLSRSSTSQNLYPMLGAHHRRQISGHDWDASLRGGSPLLEKLRRFQQGDALFVLFHAIFDSSCGPETKEYFRRTQVWSTACAKVITEGKPGSDVLTLTALNAFSDTSNWHLAPRIESYIADMLQEGAFLVDPALRSSNKSMEPLEIRNANAAIASSRFFDKALKDLLAILTNSSPAQMVPDGLLQFIRSTLLNISSTEVRGRARKFIAFKWFFSSFLGRVLTYPEVSGHIVTIVSELTAWPELKGLVSPLDPEMHSLVEQVLKRFDDTLLAPEQATPVSPSDDTDSDVQTLMLSIHDVTCLLQSLFPACGRSKTSANPSTAGSSTLVAESLYQDGVHESHGQSISEILSTSNRTSEIGPFYPLDNPTPESVEENIIDAPPLVSQADLPAEALEHRLVRVYSYLASLLPLGSATTTDVSAIAWAFVTTGTGGKIHSLHTEGSDADNHQPGHGEQGYFAGEAKVTGNELRSGIIQLLSQKDIRLSPSRALPPCAEGHVEDVNSVLSNLMSTTMDQATSEYDYQGMHYWWQMQKFLRESDSPADDLLHSISSDCQENIEMHHNVSREIGKQLYSMSLSRKIQTGKLRSEQERRNALRMKMWYASDVRHSSTFEDASHVSQALRAMATSPRSKQASGVASWARQRLKNVSWQDRSVAQTVEALTEPNEYSGACKLNDDQVERTSRWLTRHSIENFCRGEERIQRFCFEIQKCVNKLSGPNLMESPVLWSSRLFEQEKRCFDRKVPGPRGQPFQSSMTNLPSSLDQYSQSPWRPTPRGEQSAVENTSKNSTWLLNRPSVGYRQGNQLSKVDAAKAAFTAEIKADLYSLILSDLGYLPWRSGTETDSWVKQSSLDGNLALPDHHADGQNPSEKPGVERGTEDSRDWSSDRNNLGLLLVAATGVRQDSSSRWQIVPVKDTRTDDGVRIRRRQDPAPSFPYRQIYKGILHRFSMSQDPQYKLRMLHHLELLASHSIQESMSTSSSDHLPSNIDFPAGLSQSQSVLVPRTKATSFEEVIANCTERRAGTTRFNKAPQPSPPGPEGGSFGTDEIVNTFLSIFRDVDLRPSTLFRDLQYISAFVPAEILDRTAQGKAFWDAGLAALALKQEMCDAMIVRATDITNYHLSASSSRPTPPAPPSATTANNTLLHTTLQDAAHLWIIAAKEGSATAARELGLLYLTHPELLPRTTLQPFSKPKEVFRMVGARKESGSMVAEEGRLDPVTFAVVFHWMEVAASGGDRDARDFLRGNGEWGMGR